jgi:hypothetical protein
MRYRSTNLIARHWPDSHAVLFVREFSDALVKSADFLLTRRASASSTIALDQRLDPLPRRTKCPESSRLTKCPAFSRLNAFSRSACLQLAHAMRIRNRSLASDMACTHSVHVGRLMDVLLPQNTVSFCYRAEPWGMRDDSHKGSITAVTIITSRKCRPHFLRDAACDCRR